MNIETANSASAHRAKKNVVRHRASWRGGLWRRCHDLAHRVARRDHRRP
jgi:hypothetical protein